MTNPLPSISVPVIDRFRRWSPIWYKWVRPLLQSVKASANGVVEVTQTVDAAKGQWGIEVNVVNRVTAAVRLDGGAETTSFAVLADRFEVVNPADDGDVKQTFVVGNVAGTPTVGVDGDTVVDDTILARHIAVDELSAVTANVGDLTAGVAQSANGATVIDLDNEVIQITTGTRRLRYEGGDVAIYDVPSAASTDNTPLTSPLTNVSRLHFHSGLPMPAIVSTGGSYTRTGSFSLGSVGAFQNPYGVVNLFAHGRGATPIVFGRCQINSGALIPMCGSIPYFHDGIVENETFSAWGRWLHLGADATNVKMRHSGISSNQGLPAMTVAWEIIVTDFLLDGSAAAPDSAFLRIDASRFTAGQGKFDSLRRYLRADPTSGGIPLVSGRTVDIVAPRGNSTDNSSGHEIRYSVDAYTMRASSTAPTFVSSFTASFSRTSY